MKEKLLIVGTGMFAFEIVDFVKRYDLYEIVGFSVNQEYLTHEFLGLPVYPIETLEEYIDKEKVNIFIAISWYYYFNRYKRQRFEELKARGFHFANLISPLASVKARCIGEGNLIEDFAYIGYDAQIGDNNTFCARSILAHYSIIGNHNVLSGAANIAGSSTIGDNNYFGMGSLVFNSIIIGNRCLIGGGCVVKRNISNDYLITSPESYYRQTDGKINELIMSSDGLSMLNSFHDACSER